ncbi:hypothetical protein HGRIS_013325 [Hohenbuehelia grisea]|uniref:Uncharacterized protein n=1 Tax=Hohenbuehelia grisea TaxID=104357 RepID=A0ABR3IVA6_9AGAR
MPATFTPSDKFNANNEKDWAANLGMLDWDSTSIVFTKRSLIEFLKYDEHFQLLSLTHASFARYTGTTVDTHFSNIQKLPRHARFGKIEGDAIAQLGAASVSSSSSTNFLSQEVDDDALASAPPKSGQSADPSAQTQNAATAQAVQSEEEELGIPFSSQVRTTRKVREAPGGTDNISSIFGGDDEHQEFRPTRRVRQGPGGQDNINNVSGLYRIEHLQD